MRTRYRFSHRAGGRYYWESTRAVRGCLVEQVSCSVEWFWRLP